MVGMKTDGVWVVLVDSIILMLKCGVSDSGPGVTQVNAIDSLNNRCLEGGAVSADEGCGRKAGESRTHHSCHASK